MMAKYQDITIWWMWTKPRFNCQVDTHDYSSHMACPAGADWLSNPNFAWITAALWQYANEPHHMVSNFSICWLTFPKVWGYFSQSKGFASLSQLVLDDPDILILHTTNYFCCSSSWLVLNNWKLTYISFFTILLGHPGFVGEGLMIVTFVMWLSGMAGCEHIFEWGRLKAVLSHFWVLSSWIRSVVMWFYL